MMTSDEERFLERFERFLIDEIAPDAAAMDRDGSALTSGFERFKREHGLLLQMPVAQGGRLLSPPAFAVFRMQLARYAGALSFLQAQHQVAVSWLARASDPTSVQAVFDEIRTCLLYTSPSPRDLDLSRMPSSA